MSIRKKISSLLYPPFCLYCQSKMNNSTFLLCAHCQEELFAYRLFTSQHNSYCCFANNPLLTFLIRASIEKREKAFIKPLAAFFFFSYQENFHEKNLAVELLFSSKEEKKILSQIAKYLKKWAKEAFNSGEAKIAISFYEVESELPLITLSNL